MRRINFNSIGYTIAVFGVAIVLIWIGVFKFTPTEAKAIEPLVRNHPLMSWLYNITSVQGVSNIIGTVELIAAAFLLLHFLWKIAGLVGGILSAGIFLFTLSFLITTPAVSKTVDSMLVTDFFILKDITGLGVGLLVIGRSASGKL